MQNTTTSLMADDTMTFADLACLAHQNAGGILSDADNAGRAGAAAAALVTFARCTGLDADGEPAATAVVDLLADLMHLCGGTGMPFCELLVSAAQHYGCEADT
ncbi:hypothetical protein [Pantoea agglomerans]|uniref:Uncharacterized protein n=1 Tax=Enterobacter agglomerans TaxID=549 RepID=A0AAN2FHV4_ENTAG|nr:hypothetical protein [Pantoea agglomerans]CAH6375619.1 hypothetical protein DAPPPG734_23990 [Pantoea agglomerans]